MGIVGIFTKTNAQQRMFFLVGAGFFALMAYLIHVLGYKDSGIPMYLLLLEALWLWIATTWRWLRKPDPVGMLVLVCLIAIGVIGSMIMGLFFRISPLYLVAALSPTGLSTITDFFLLVFAFIALCITLSGYIILGQVWWLLYPRVVTHDSSPLLQRCSDEIRIIAPIPVWLCAFMAVWTFLIGGTFGAGFFGLTW